MKTSLKQLLFIAILAITAISQAQIHNNQWLFNARVGYDFPTYENNTPYIDYKGGLDLGLSVDYYWNWFGIGADADYIWNKPESTYPTDNLFSTGNIALTDFSLSEQKINRLFYGIGPSFRYVNQNGRFSAELNLRGGLANIKGGRTELRENTVINDVLNFHSGYDDKNVLSAKGQIRAIYFVNSWLGLHAGAYYLRHFNVEEQLDPIYNRTAGYYPVIDNQGTNTVNQNALNIRDESCDCDIFSVGVFAGITVAFGNKKAADVCPVCGEDHTPHCCATCGCTVTITARDKYTQQLLANTDVVLEDANGTITQTGTTNSYGVVVFQEVATSNYLVKGKLYEVNLEETTIAKAEFDMCKKDGKGIQKEIIYTDENFILRGNVVECNKNEGIPGVDISLKDTKSPSQKNTLSDTDGNFIFHLKQASVYSVQGAKDGYFSNKAEVNTINTDRNTDLFIDFEMCVDPCGKAIRLDNIIFNLDKWDILPAARQDLDYVAQLMQDNPTIKVEMSSHTDSRGSNAYNQELSQKRAQSTVDYLLAKGISRDRLIARGAGETQLLNSCADGVQCTEVEHTINRRTEFKVICF
ncbi:OmpA family protein [Leeuwenhoekiella sp. W20_SRS_FM14]|uniref:OmpA family protein n=1 Tax=Leeuwenhoekiella sp. W20_SRS_FM14 TaxID=3240270 RepID=UPI003F9890C3